MKEKNFYSLSDVVKMATNDLKWKRTLYSMMLLSKWYNRPAE